MKFEVVNLDKNGNVIPDLSKVEVPEDLQRKVIAVLLRGGQYEKTHENTPAISKQRILHTS